MGPTLTIASYQRHVVNPRLRYFKLPEERCERAFALEIASSLEGPRRSIDPKFFYDERGSSLFEEICDLPEYYLTRTEAEILSGIRDELAGLLDARMRLVELGSGSSTKTRLILDAFASVQVKMEYIPIDISETLEPSCRRLLDEYENLHVTGIIGTYQNGLDFLHRLDGAPKLIIFLGSSFGNFGAQEGSRFLERVSTSMNREDLFLIGLDLVKERRVMEDAYNDSRGLTARFNLNLLSRINEELDGDFDLSNFSHLARFNETESRMEMYIRSRTDQTVTIRKSNLEMNLRRGDLIHTEDSHKYTVPRIREMMSHAGLGINRIWRDARGLYCMVLCKKF